MVGQQRNGDTMTRQTNMNEARLMKENRELNEQSLRSVMDTESMARAVARATTVGDGLISGEDVIVMSRIEEDKLPPAEDEQDERKELS